MALKRINSIYFLADSKEDLQTITHPAMGTECFVIEEACEYRCTSDGRWIKQVINTNEENTSVDLDNYVTKAELDEAFEENKVTKTFGEDPEIMKHNPGSAFGIAIIEGETKTIVEAMYEKGIGLYTCWIYKGSEDLPAEVKAKNSSCRGLCCVDTVKDTGWYGWIQIFDHEGFMYTRYIRNSVPSEWRAC